MSNKVNPNILTVADLTALAAIGRPEALQVLVTGIGIFNWASSGTPDGTTIIAANLGGAWIKQMTSGGDAPWHALTEASTIAVDINDGPLQKVELNANRAITISNAFDGAKLLLKIKHVVAGTFITDLPGIRPATFFWADSENETTILGGVYDATEDIWNWDFQVYPDPDFAPDLDPPSLVSADTTDITHFELVFNENVNTSTAGWTAKKNGSSLAISAIAGSGTNTLSFTVATMDNGDTIEVSYDASLGDAMDDSGNTLNSFTDQAVTNHIAGTTFITWNSIDSNQEQYNSNKGLRKVSGATAAWNNPSFSNQTIDDGEAVVFKLDVTGYMILGLTSARSGNPGGVAGDWDAYFQMIGNVYTDNTGFGSLGDSGVAEATGLYLRITRSGGNFIYAYSNDDISYTDIHTLAGASGAYYVGVLIYGNNTNAGVSEVKKV